MAQPLHQRTRWTYADGTKATAGAGGRTTSSTFLTYVANPEMEQRKRLGVRIVLFLAFLSCVTYAVKRKVWAHVH